MNLPTAEQLAESIKSQIIHLRRMIPQNVKSFEELHDHVDANTLGGTEALYEKLTAEADGTDASLQACLDRLSEIMNPAQDIVDRWLKAGGLVKARKAVA